jgi:16S rRNA (guanine966-N2)-methyltransferase
MRIIAGEFRARLLTPPPGDATRPITDRAKQSIFDVLNPLIDDAVVFDCFCGTGSMGLECLSRNARQAFFFDADRGALLGLKKNIDALGVQSRSRVLAGDLFKRIPTLKDQPSLIFLDPPYRYLVEKPLPLQQLSLVLSKMSTPDATLIFRHDTKDQLSLPGWEQADVRTYGSMTIELLNPSNIPEPGA